MKEKQTRRDFLKTTSASAAGVTAISLTPWSSAAKPRQSSRVVIIKDERSFVNNQPDKDIIQEMVNHAIIKLTGVEDTPLAYEALFPEGGLSAETKILIKFNNLKPETTQNPVLEALENGLTSMLGGAFPPSNITRMGKQTGSASSKTFQIGNKTFTISQPWVDCDYFINCPSAWNISYTGVTMSLKGMMPSVSERQDGLHNDFLSDTSPSLSIISSQPDLKDKQVLVLLDAISVCAASNQVKAGHKIVASKDMVAADYQGMLILKEHGLSSGDETTALKVFELAAKEPYNLGTDNPENMEIITWDPSDINNKTNSRISGSQIKVKTNPTHTVFSYPKKTGAHATVSIYDMHGKEVWSVKSSENRIVWHNNNLKGNKVPSGNFLYKLKIGDVTSQGKITVKR